MNYNDNNQETTMKNLTNKLLAGMLSAAVLLPAVGFSTTAVANDRIKAQAYGDSNFNQNRQKAMQMLSSRGYQVAKIEVDDYLGKPVFEVEAYKNGAEYDIVLEYPSLNILKEQRDY